MPRDAVKLEPLACTTTTGIAFLVPLNIESAPPSLVSYLCRCFNLEVDAADTYPHNQHMTVEEFKNYWFGYTGIVLLADSPDVNDDRDWETDVLGTYYIKPNYLGAGIADHRQMLINHRSCNAGFIVPVPQRKHKYGKVLARSFPHFASRLEYRSSVFNLVFESNKASTRLWDQFGYKRVGRIEEAINIKGNWTAAIVYQGNFLDGSVVTTFEDEVYV